MLRRSRRVRSAYVDAQYQLMYGELESSADCLDAFLDYSDRSIDFLKDALDELESSKVKFLRRDLQDVVHEFEDNLLEIARLASKFRNARR